MYARDRDRLMLPIDRERGSDDSGVCWWWICHHTDVAGDRGRSDAERHAETAIILGFFWWIPIVSFPGAICSARALHRSERRTRARRLAIVGCLSAVLGIAWTALIVLWLLAGAVY